MAAPAVAAHHGHHEHRVGAPPGAQPSGVYRPRRPRASPLYGLLDRRFRHLSLVYDEQFAHTYGPWRAVVPAVVDRFLACGILEHGFARIRCDVCAHEYLLAFSCRSRYFCPSCHAKRLARWTLWLDEALLAPVPHRQQEREARPRVRVSAPCVCASVRPCLWHPDPRLPGQLASPSASRRDRRRLPARRHLRALARLAGLQFGSAYVRHRASGPVVRVRARSGAMDRALPPSRASRARGRVLRGGLVEGVAREFHAVELDLREAAAEVGDDLGDADSVN